ncbi:uncharacterized protein EV422DRAFT_495324 [Fimicolochytrium jonesii]|uniref:uncharacterized protein n=1 Tax=Fimicolochytrium jonesii TaxID=1396493 RepID=UPI0022FE5C5F|nr:uncharacterized protein EV422DRAFT_495324 [Fimicolochytrium jonesii]KAI8821714.1 hypothetical protein EV422DRAFT_495324 [Fimicolochytrium jonesii]
MSPAATAPHAAIRRTGLQRDVLDLYRALHRAIRQKPESARSHFYHHVQTKFRQDAASVTVKDITTIEYLLRRGRRQLEVLRSDAVVDIH